MRRRADKHTHRWLLAACVLAGACDESPTAPSRQDLAGRWLVVSLRPATAPPITPPAGALAVEFADDRLSVRGDCNICSGRYALVERTLTVSPLACTRRACPPGSLDEPLFELVGAADRALLTAGPLLVLEGPRGRVLLRR